MGMAQKISVDIVADLVCPWCWLGKRNWDTAREAVPEIEVETVWRPYQLDPTLPREGKPYRDYMKAKFAGEDAARWNAMREHLEQAAPGAGIEFRFDAITRRPNTLDAHRLMRWARGQNVADAMAEGLFAAFFRDGRDIGDRSELVRASRRRPGSMRPSFPTCWPPTAMPRMSGTRRSSSASSA